MGSCSFRGLGFKSCLGCSVMDWYPAPTLCDPTWDNQFHFNWGDTNTCGSEHSIDQNLYPLHFVHWNSSQYRVFEDAMMEENGFAVIRVFLKRHEDLQKLMDILPAVKHKGRVAEFTEFNPHCLLPEHTEEYWTYPGSFTTPSVTEVVTWIIMKNPVEVSIDQIFTLLFTSVEDEVQKNMVNNFCCQQPLKGCTMRSSFPHALWEAPIHQSTLAFHVSPDVL
uniref:Alpha-carbonic anhydrase domain-containing protein n=1 Tax=Scleropages formosus TaxID=113540 RepID=A0A8C9W7M8_SCLFO